MMMNRQLASLSSLTNDATVQQDIESSNQAFECVSLKALGSKNFSVQLWQYAFFS